MKLNYFFFSDCESLVRKILVRDPDRRYTVAQIKRHRWMQAEVPEEEKRERQQQQQKQQEEDKGKVDKEEEHQHRRARRCDKPLNEGILKIMADLGIDTSVTREVRRDWFFFSLRFSS